MANNEGLGSKLENTEGVLGPIAPPNEGRASDQIALSLATTRTRHIGSGPVFKRDQPDLWTDEFAFLSQPGQADIQSDLFI